MQLVTLVTTLATLISLLVTHTSAFTPRRRGSYKGKNSQARIQELCKDRIFNEFFREQTENCAKVVKCDTSRYKLYNDIVHIS